MSKKKLLISEVFRKAQEEFPNKNTKSGWSSELSDYFYKRWKFLINERTFVRYYNASIRDDREPDIVDKEILDKLSEYIGYENFAEFSRTSIKKDEEASTTTVKVDIDNEDVPLGASGPNVTVNITNTNSNENNQHFKVPDFIKQNGMGIIEMALILCLVTGNVMFSNGKKEESNGSSFHLGFMSGGKPAIEKKYMYWDGERYIATDSSYIRPGINIVAMNQHKYLYFQKIMKKDTLTEENALGRTWYSKYNSVVEFFTEDGVDPENGRELRKSTPFIIYKYAGQPKDSIDVE
ncbi:hypothetical protein [Chryseobacterium sp. Mn2064]|uniref:hypothetical protein n=1 Tax=Chryseobacterium sp. Mn2064 TaxID=3395263 RepID=UPI003BCF613A